MKVFKIEIKNYRLLKNFSMDLEEDLSLIIGKNNTGKTSILLALEKFLSQTERNNFSFDDFNIEFKKEISRLIDSDEEVLEDKYDRLGIKLRLFIQYTETDNLSNVSRVMMDLDPNNNVIVLGFEYSMDFNGCSSLKKDYAEFKSTEKIKKEAKPDYSIRSVYDFLRLHQTNYFKINKRSFEYDPTSQLANEEVSIDLEKEKISISDIINFKYISAKRDVANKDVDKTLSGQTSRIYRRTETSDDQNQAVEDFKDKLSETDSHLSGIYKALFEDIVKKVRDFGGIKINESEIEIISTLQHRELLEGNTTVVYKHDEGNHLPEHYNGLGYMNLISMIFEIEILVNEFKREKDKKPADINLLFIEEPEAHTHPQMQYIFIKNIKSLLGEGIKREDGENRNLQYIISTHSACILSDSDFGDIKYLKKESGSGIIAKNLKALESEYKEETAQYQFLKQYLTISRAEIFFADKAILIEGDTERILIPTLMRKIDIEEKKKYEVSGERDKCLPLLSQNISVIEVGAYSQIFEKFIEFLGIKSLIITDIDAVMVTGQDEKGKDIINACRVSEGTSSSNSALNHFFSDKSWYDLIDSPIESRMILLGEASVLISYQSSQNGYHGRSVEDAFISLNIDFVKEKRSEFRGLKNIKYLDDPAKDPYDLAHDCVNKKTHFALDILYHSNEELSNWEIPDYIKEGLLWLKKD
ncbi:MAG: ATP-dependent endonuclease [Haliscomenobacter sp.]|nr:ATP-dependent endonuclease [Haliscomenobacter sp.]